MVQSVLGSLVLGYRPLWNAARKLAGVQLYVHGHGSQRVDGAHLLRTLQELWSAASAPLLLSPRSQALLIDLLQHAPRGAPWIAVPGDWLALPAVRENVQRAHGRGLCLVWSGTLSRLPDADTARLFDNSLLQLSGGDAAAALQAAGGKQPSPLIAGQMYDNVASRALLSQCLDQGRALAVAGWPMEDVLHSLRHQPLAPAHEVVQKLLKAIDDDQSIDRLEQILGQDPLLAHRFLVYTNSAALGLRTGVDSLRRGLVMMGYGSLSRWLSDQLPHCATEPDLRPIRSAMVLRARLTEQLLQAGALQITSGEFLFRNGCAACHSIGDGDRIGPDLKDVAKRRDPVWLEKFVRTPDVLLDGGDPIARELLQRHKGVRMPNLGLKPDEVAEILGYIEARSAKVAQHP